MSRTNGTLANITRRHFIAAFGVFLSALACTFSDNAHAYQADWAHNASDLKPDPAVTFGKLPNGMRYAIMHNNTPTDAVSMRFRIDAGSLQESDAQQGIAHLLEHMAFRGSKNVADGDVVKTLERIGLQFGGDTNAFTAQTETVYKFDMPKSDANSVDTGLMLLREVASELNISAEALATERGVVLSELRLRDTPNYRATKANLAALMPGQRAAQRFPGGEPKVIESATPALIRSFYEAFYRPERATLVVTGNIDPAALEKKIIAKFSDWKSGKPVVEDPDLGKPQLQGLTTKVYSEAGLQTELSLNWLQAYDGSAVTSAREKDDAVALVGNMVLNQRFQQTALSTDAPFTRAQAYHAANFLHSAQLTSVGVNITPEKWQTAMQATQKIVRDALTRGVGQDEVDRVVAGIRTNMRNSVTGANTRRTPGLADELVESVDDNEVFLSPQQSLELVEAAFKDLKADAVSAVMRKTYSGNGPLVFMQSVTPIPDGEAALAKLYNEYASESVTEAASAVAQATITWPYTQFGKPGKVAARKKVEDLNTTFVRFDNGLSLAVKPTQFSVGQVQVVLKIGDGRIALPKNKATASFLLPALVSGGLDQIDYPTMIKALAGKSYAVRPALNDNHVLLGGQTTPNDLDTQLQIMAAYISAPAFRAGAIEQIRSSLLAQIPQIEAQALSNMYVHLDEQLHSNDSRWMFPTQAEVQAAKVEELKAWLEPMLKRGSLQVAIVGDVDVEKTIVAVAATLGALNKRPAPSKKVMEVPEAKFPAGTTMPVVAHHKGSADKAGVVMAWPAPDRRQDFAEVVNMQVLSAVMQLRLLDAIRAQAGVGYSPNGGYNGSWAIKNYGALISATDIRPEQTQVFFDAVANASAELRNKPVSDDELKRALQPAIANAEKALQNNGYLAQLLVAPELDPQATEYLRKQVELLKGVTAASVQRVAQKYLLDEKAWKEVMLPSQSAGGEK